MPEINGQWGARMRTSSPGSRMAPATAPSAPVAPVATRRFGFSVDTPVLRVYGRKPDFRVVCRAHDWRWGILVRSDLSIDRLADLKG